MEPGIWGEIEGIMGTQVWGVGMRTEPETGGRRWDIGDTDMGCEGIGDADMG